jgi:hypothetical protein
MLLDGDTDRSCSTQHDTEPSSYGLPLWGGGRHIAAGKQQQSPGC